MHKISAGAFVATLALTQGVLAAVVEAPAELKTCEPAKITWKDAPEGDLTLVVGPAESSADTLADLGKQTGATGEVTWTVNVPADTNVAFRLTGSDGDITTSSPIVVKAGSNTDCIKADGLEGSMSSMASSAASSVSEAASSASNAVSSAASSASSVASSVSSAVSSISNSLLPSGTGALNATGTLSPAAPGAGFATFKISVFAATFAAGILAAVTLT